MIVGFVLVLLAIAGGIATFAYVCRMRQFALRNQYLHRHGATQRPGTVEIPNYPTALVQLKPVTTYSPAAEDEGTMRECPICFEETTQNQEWLLLPCKHGVCMNCYQKLVQDQHRVTTCPLCRMPLLEPVPLPPPALQLVSPQMSSPLSSPMASPMSCPWVSQQTPSSVHAASYSSNHNSPPEVIAPLTPPQQAVFQHQLATQPIFVSPMTSIV